MASASYLIALGSNRRHVRHGAPGGVVRAAFRALDGDGLHIVRTSSILTTAALGPAGRNFANAAAIVTTDLPPPELLLRLKAIERQFGRRGGRRWGARTLDLDIILWTGGAWPHRLRWAFAHGLVIPHRSMQERAFVLRPAAGIAGGWRDPRTGLAVRQLLGRLRQSRH